MYACNITDVTRSHAGKKTVCGRFGDFSITTTFTCDSVNPYTVLPGSIVFVDHTVLPALLQKNFEWQVPANL